MSGMTHGAARVIAVLGSTGSVGRQTLEVAARQGLSVDLLTANRDVATMEAQARAFAPRTVVMADPTAAAALQTKLADTSIRVLSGADAIPAAIGESRADTFVNAILGEAGLLPTLAVLDTGKRLALANKESLVVAGEIVMRRARERGAELLPVDSEHSAIFQCLAAGRKSEVSRLILTCSGGAFFGYTKEELRRVTVEQALGHPTWNMGAKITADCATLMNKGLEIIEAMHLFAMPVNKIDVVIHRESIIHSMVEYIDNAVIAQLGDHDMRLPIQYAFTYPKRATFAGKGRGLDFADIAKLTFFRPDEERFPLLALAKRMAKKGGCMPCVMNAANEAAVALFRAGKMPFYGIAETVGAVCDEFPFTENPTLSDIIAYNANAREMAEHYAAETYSPIL